MKSFGQLVAVCVGPVGNVPKYPQSQAIVGQFGLEGDYHAGETRISRSTGQPKPNDRAISLVAWEVFVGLNSEIGSSAGDFTDDRRRTHSQSD